MSTQTFDAKWVKTRKPHRCIGCWGPIPVLEICHYWKGLCDGDFQFNYMHRECQEALDASADEEFTPGDFPFPERLRMKGAQ